MKSEMQQTTKTIVLLMHALLLLSVSATAQLTPQVATSINSVVAGDFGLCPNAENL